MRPYILLVITLQLLCCALSAQDTLFQIRLGTFTESVNFRPYDKLKDLGRLTVVPLRADLRRLTDTSRLYLGIYIGRETALKALAYVQQRGFPDAFLEADDRAALPAEGLMGVQVAVSAHLEMHRFHALDHPFYIVWEDGYFKVFSFLFVPARISPYELRLMLDFGRAEGLSPFVRPLVR